MADPHQTDAVTTKPDAPQGQAQLDASTAASTKALAEVHADAGAKTSATDATAPVADSTGAAKPDLVDSISAAAASAWSSTESASFQLVLEHTCRCHGFQGSWFCRSGQSLGPRQCRQCCPRRCRFQGHRFQGHRLHGRSQGRPGDGG